MMKMVKHQFLAAAAAFSMGCLATAPANAAVVVVNTSGTWTTVDETVGVGNFFTDTYKAATALTLRFTDLYYVGDSYAVYKNGAFQFNSSAFNPATAFDADPTSAYNTAGFSKGTISLAANDIVSFKVLTIPAGFTDSTIAISGIAAAVPEPATWAMLLVGFGMMGASMRYRRRSTTTAYA